MNRVIVITGASSGIGMSAAREFLRCKDTVISLSRRPSVDDAVHIPCDISEEELSQLNKTLTVALDIDTQQADAKICSELAKEREQHKMEVQMLYERNKDLEAQNALLRKELDKRPCTEAIESEARMYKKLYSDLLKTLAGKEI